MILRYWGANVTLQDVLSKIGYPPITSDTLRNAVEAFGFTLNYVGRSNIEDLKNSTGAFP